MKMIKIYQQLVDKKVNGAILLFNYPG